MSKKIYFIGSLVLSSFLVVSTLLFPTVKNSYASLTTQVSPKSSVSLPKYEDINNKVHANKIKDIVSKSKNLQIDVKNYIDTLNKDDLLLSIAEVCDDLGNSSNTNVLTIFGPATSQKLIGNMTNADYELIFMNPDYPVSFKFYAADIKSSENFHKNTKNDKAYNKLLRNMFQDETQNESLRLVSLINTDDYTVEDIPALELLTHSKKSSDIMKANAVRILKRIDKNKGNIHVQQILKNLDQYSESEVTVALDTLGDYTNQTAMITGTEDEIDLINTVIKQTTNTHIIQSTVFALANFKNKKSVTTVLENRSKINDDYAIRFYVDRNYLVVENMLDSNDNSAVSSALTCVEITPFKSFLPKIIELEASATNNEVKSRLGNLIHLINSSEIDRNVKWDGQYKKKGEV